MQENNTKKIILLTLIICLASILRLWNLSLVPASLNLDETAIGYDAFSILKTKKDQFGKTLPLAFRSTNDYKLPVYVYLTTAAMSVIGDKEVAVRATSAVAGIIVVALTFVLTNILFDKHRFHTKLPLLAAFLLAVSPWHLQFSRMGAESNLSLLFNISMIIFFLKYIDNKRGRFLILSAVFFGLNLFTYHSARFVSPLLLIAMIFLYRKKIILNRQWVLFSLVSVIFIIIYLPLSFDKNIQMRFWTMNIFNLDNKIYHLNNLRVNEAGRGLTFSPKIFHNARFVFLNPELWFTFITNFSKHFSFDFLFMGDDNKMYHTPDFGLMYFHEIYLFYLGLVLVLFFIKDINKKIIVTLWFITSLIPSSLTWHAPSSVRALILLPLPQIIIGTSILFIFDLIKSNTRVLKGYFFKLVYLLILMSSFTQYLHYYLFHLNYQYAPDWFYGRKEAVAAVEKLKNKYDKVIVSNNQTNWLYISWLFYSNYNPRTYITVDGGTKSGDFRANEKFDKYEFVFFNQSELPINGKYLIIAAPIDFKDIMIKDYGKSMLIKGFKVLQSIKYPDGKVTLQIRENTYGYTTIPKPE